MRFFFFPRRTVICGIILLVGVIVLLIVLRLKSCSGNAAWQEFSFFEYIMKIHL